MNSWIYLSILLPSIHPPTYPSTSRVIYHLLILLSFVCLSVFLSILPSIHPPTQLSIYLLEKEMATHSSILAWKIPWTEEPGRLQPVGSQRIRHD